jgi:hypothetical protein
MKLNKLNFGICIALLAATGCVNVTVDEPSACSNQNVSFPLASAVSAFAPPSLCNSPSVATSTATFQIPPQSTTTTFDFSSELNGISNAADNLSVLITQLVMSNPNKEFFFASSIEVDIAGQNSNSGSYPQVELAMFTVGDAGAPSSFAFTPTLPTATVLSYLESGPVTLTITLNSSPITLAQACTISNDTTASTMVNVCVNASGSFSKKL